MTQKIEILSNKGAGVTISVPAAGSTIRLATGVGEMPLLAVPPAILDAVHDAVGVWPDGIPLTPERMLQALEKEKGDFDAQNE